MRGGPGGGHVVPAKAVCFAIGKAETPDKRDVKKGFPSFRCPPGGFEAFDTRVPVGSAGGLLRCAAQRGGNLKDGLHVRAALVVMVDDQFLLRSGQVP